MIPVTHGSNQTYFIGRYCPRFHKRRAIPPSSWPVKNAPINTTNVDRPHPRLVKSRMDTTMSTGRCTARNHRGENLRTLARQYPKGILTSTTAAATPHRVCSGDRLIYPVYAGCVIVLARHYFSDTACMSTFSHCSCSRRRSNFSSASVRARSPISRTLSGWSRRSRKASASWAGWRSSTSSPHRA